jgi:hypothetical protein
VTTGYNQKHKLKMLYMKTKPSSEWWKSHELHLTSLTRLLSRSDSAFRCHNWVVQLSIESNMMNL